MKEMMPYGNQMVSIQRFSQCGRTDGDQEFGAFKAEIVGLLGRSSR